MARAHSSVSTRDVRSCRRSASPDPGQSTCSTEIPRAAISVGQPEVYMCSFVESRPFHMIMTGTGSPSLLALVKYAGNDVPSNGISTREVAGSTSSKDFSISSSRCRYVGTRSGEELLSMRSAWQRYAAARKYFCPVDLVDGATAVQRGDHAEVPDVVAREVLEHLSCSLCGPARVEMG